MFLQIEDMKHIKRNYYSDAWVMPRGWDLEAPGVPRARGSKNFFEHGYVAYQIDGYDEQTECK